MMRKDEVPFHRAVKHYLDRLEQMYAARAKELEPDEIRGLEYVRRDHLRLLSLVASGAAPDKVVRAR